MFLLPLSLASIATSENVLNLNEQEKKRILHLTKSVGKNNPEWVVQQEQIKKQNDKKEAEERGIFGEHLSAIISKKQPSITYEKPKQHYYVGEKLMLDEIEKQHKAEREKLKEYVIDKQLGKQKESVLLEAEKFENAIVKPVQMQKKAKIVEKEASIVQDIKRQKLRDFVLDKEAGLAKEDLLTKNEKAENDAIIKAKKQKMPANTAKAEKDAQEIQNIKRKKLHDYITDKDFGIKRESNYKMKETKKFDDIRFKNHAVKSKERLETEKLLKELDDIKNIRLQKEFIEDVKKPALLDLELKREKDIVERETEKLLKENEKAANDAIINSNKQKMPANIAKAEKEAEEIQNMKRQKLHSYITDKDSGVKRESNYKMKEAKKFDDIRFKEHAKKIKTKMENALEQERVETENLLNDLDNIKKLRLQKKLTDDFNKDVKKPALEELEKERVETEKLLKEFDNIKKLRLQKKLLEERHNFNKDVKKPALVELEKEREQEIVETEKLLKEFDDIKKLRLQKKLLEERHNFNKDVKKPALVELEKEREQEIVETEKLLKEISEIRQKRLEDERQKIKDKFTKDVINPVILKKQDEIKQSKDSAIPVKIAQAEIDIAQKAITSAEIATLVPITATGLTIGASNLVKNISKDLLTNVSLPISSYNTTETKYDKNLGDDSIVSLKEKKDKSEMPKKEITDKAAQGAANRLLVTLAVTDGPYAYRYLVDKFDKHDISKILKTAALFKDVPVNVKDFFEHPETPNLLQKYYYVPKTDPEYHAKVPNKWANLRADVDFKNLKIPVFDAEPVHVDNPIVKHGDILTPNATKILENHEEKYFKKKDFDENAERQKHFYEGLRSNINSKSYSDVNDLKEDLKTLDQFSANFNEEDKKKHEDFLYKKIDEFLEIGLNKDIRDFSHSTLSKKPETIKAIEEAEKLGYKFSNQANAYVKYLKSLSESERYKEIHDISEKLDNEGLSFKDILGLNSQKKIKLVKDTLLEDGRTMWVDAQSHEGKQMKAVRDTRDVSVEDLDSKYEDFGQSSITGDRRYITKPIPKGPTAQDIEMKGPVQAGHQQFIEGIGYHGETIAGTTNIDTKSAPPDAAKPEKPEYFDSTAFNPKVEPRAVLGDVLAEAATNIAFDAAGVAATMAAAKGFGPYGAYLFSSIYNNYAKDLLTQNQMYSKEASQISNRITGEAVKAYDAFTGNFRQEPRVEKRKDFMQGNSNPDNQPANKKSALFRQEGFGSFQTQVVPARNELNDFGFEQQMINPMSSVNELNPVSEIVSDAFLQRSSTDSIHLAQQDYMTYFRNSAPYPVR